MQPASKSPKEHHRCVRQGGKWERKILKPSRGISGGRKQRLELALGHDVGVKNLPSCQGDLVWIARCIQYPAALPEEDRARLARFVDGLELITKLERSLCPSFLQQHTSPAGLHPAQPPLTCTKGVRRGRLPAQNNRTWPRKREVGRLQLQVTQLQGKGLR